MGSEDKNPFVAIPASLGGIFMVITILFLVLGRDNLLYLVPLLWGFVALGIAALFFAYLSNKTQKIKSVSDKKKK